MKGIIYELHVSMGVLDYTHGQWTTIEELFIPKMKICFNSKGYAFETDKSRYNKNKKQKNMPNQPDPKKIKEIDVTSEDVAELLAIVHKRKAINRLSKKFFDIEVYKEPEGEKE